MTVINTNIKSLVTQNALQRNSRDVSLAMEQLSTGKRINRARDDAAGLAISSRMTAQLSGLGQAVRNAHDGISLIQTAEGALVEVTHMLQRMRELAVQSATDTYSDNDRQALDLEYDQLMAEVARIANNTQWNGMNLLKNEQDARLAIGTGGSAGDPLQEGEDLRLVRLQVGANARQTIGVTLRDFSFELDETHTTPSAAVFSESARLNDTGIADRTGAQTALARLDRALERVNAERALYGAVVNRLTYAGDNLENVSLNTSDSRSRILDADYAAASSELSRTQIIQQAATAVLAQANIDQQAVLKLLQG